MKDNYNYTKFYLCKSIDKKGHIWDSTARTTELYGATQTIAEEKGTAENMGRKLLIVYKTDSEYKNGDIVYIAPELQI